MGGGLGTGALLLSGQKMVCLSLIVAEMSIYSCLPQDSSRWVMDCMSGFPLLLCC